MKKSDLSVAACAVMMAWGVGVRTGAAEVPRTGTQLAHTERSIRIGFWLGMYNTETMTPDMIDWLGERASFVIIRGKIVGLDPYYDYKTIIQRFKERAPNVPMLIYDRPQDTGRTLPSSIHLENGDEVLAHPEWLLRNSDGSVFVPRGDPDASNDVPIDPTNPEFRAYIAEYLADAIRRYGADGVATDAYSKVAPLYFGDLSRLMNGERLTNGGYEEGAAAMTAAIKQAIGPDKIFIFNSLGHNTPNRKKLDIQATLLPLTDGGAEEWFGYERTGNEHDNFDLVVLDTIKAMAAHPDKIIPVYGRCPRYVYLGYEEDYQFQRYDLACYLLGMTPRSTYKYHVSFQAAPTPRQRTWGFEYYRDYDLDLGKLMGGFTQSEGVYQRRFEKALAAVAPLNRGDRELTVEGTWFTPEGERVEGTVKLADGHGMILLREAPNPEPARVSIDDFENGEAKAWREGVRDEGTGVFKEGGNHFLRATLSPKAFRPYHERRIQPIRSLIPYERIVFRIRTKDKAGAVMVRVEVDDWRPNPVPEKVMEKPPASIRGYKEETRMPYAVLVIRPEGGSFTFKALGADIPYGVMEFQSVSPQVPFYATKGVGYQANGQWQTVTLDLKQAFARVAPHLTARRITDMRLMGDADLDDMAIERENTTPNR